MTKASLRTTDVGFLILGVAFWGPRNKDHSTWGSLLVSPFLGKLPDCLHKCGP